ncbi:glycoside hydrolase family 43 protein [Chitinophaga sp. sic0106]|uniref:glycoside hydrolase family 43 protein n=1 Tax=Chitinophaga sp. sic0106 TaxID=2854785 RepID=UPI001C451C1C|nr:glycoside hydrolase family 43 protein [Chitinophaga sp. sic0106]MBV7529203.1 glycoside hydrolase family 43 protein [Chitinophaga sp. sic0106]
MKRWLLLLLTFVSISAVAQDSVYLFCYFKDNGKDGLHLAYSRDSYKWVALNGDSSLLKPTAGKDKLMRDPCIIQGPDKLFHMVWTVSWNERTIGYASSPDLIHWSAQQTVPVMEHEPTAKNCWAPEIMYDPGSKKYMIYWATTIPGRFQAGDTSGDDKYNHRLYYTLTKDFKQYSKAALLYDPGFNCIDATIQQDGHQWVMFFKDETRYPPAKNLRVAYSKKLTGGYVMTGSPITGNYWAEGPTALHTSNGWLVYFDKYRDHKYGLVKVTGEGRQDESDKLQLPAGIRHGSVFKVSKAIFDQLPR